VIIKILIYRKQERDTPSPPSSTSLKQISQIVLTTIGITHENLPEKITLTFATTEHQAFNDNVRQATTNVQQG
jgi:hypothetical protein